MPRAIDGRKELNDNFASQKRILEYTAGSNENKNKNKIERGRDGIRGRRRICD
jgi:hypothetical protein